MKGLCGNFFSFFLFTISISAFCLPVFSQSVSYNKNYELVSHNSFDLRYENIKSLLLLTSGIELDIWDNYWGSGLLSMGRKMDHNWYVKHSPLEKGNKNCCGGAFSECLKSIKEWTDLNPDHHVLTIFIDKKENWSEGNEFRRPLDLDQLLMLTFGQEKIFSPAFLAEWNRERTLSDTLNSWPTLELLSGKLIFVITNGTEITSRNPLDEYLSEQKEQALCFVAPLIQNELEISTPSGISAANIKFINFYNLEYVDRSLLPKISKTNHLVRVFNVPETYETHKELMDDMVNFIAVDSISSLQKAKH